MNVRKKWQRSFINKLYLKERNDHTEYEPNINHLDVSSLGESVEDSNIPNKDDNSYTDIKIGNTATAGAKYLKVIRL